MKIVKGQTALITGASKGLGVYMARALAAKGMNLVLAARSVGLLEEVRKEIEGIAVKAIAVPTDVASRTSLEHLVNRSVMEFGQIDVLVNNAGIEFTVAYDALALDDIEQMIRVNLAAPMFLTRLVLPAMLARNSGYIVNISSGAGLLPTPYSEPYAATKFGLVGFTRSLRLTVQEMGSAVSASVICPGFMDDAGMYEDMKEQSGEKVPWIIGSLPAQKVADAVVRAIETDVPDIIVMPGAPRGLMALNAFAPRFLEKMAKKLRLFSIYRAVAENRARDRASRAA